MTVLGLDDSKCLTEITDISGLQNLKEYSFERCNNLLTIHDSIGFLNKLKILNAQGCSKLLGLSFCYRLKNFPEILGNMENIVGIKLVKTSIEELPDSFKNLTGLNNLRLHGFGMLLRLPSNILMMPKLSWIDVQGYHLLPNQSDKPSPMVSTNVQSLVHRKCNRTDESFPIILKWFANMTHLDLLKSNFTILPECLQEIRWFPPNLKCLSALNCKSSSSSCRNMLLNQVLFFLVFNLIFHSILHICKLTSSL